MKPTNLLIIGGAVVLGGLYLSNKSKKAKEDALALSNAQTQTNTPATQSVSTQELLTAQEATVYATKTIADVNSLLVKYPQLTMNQFIDNYNSVHKTNLAIGGDAILGFKFYAPALTLKDVASQSNSPIVQDTTSGQGWNFGAIVSNIGASLNQSRSLELSNTENQFMASNANKVFNAIKITYNHWKSDFSTVYSNLKDYFTTLTKEQADVIIKYLPKAIVASLMGENDPRVRANDFYSQEEIIDMVDNKLDMESILKSALGEFFSNMRNLAGYGYGGGEVTTIAVPSNVISATATPFTP